MDTNMETEFQDSGLDVASLQAELDQRYADRGGGGAEPVTDLPVKSETQPATTEVQTAATVEPPKTWRPEAAAHFNALPEPVKQEILKREDDMWKGIEQYKGDATFGKSIQQVMAPYMSILEQYNIAPEAQIKDLMQVHHTLAFGQPEQKAQLLQEIARQYGVNLGGEQQAYVDPEVQGLKGQLSQLQQQLQAIQQQHYNAKAAQVNQEVTAFSNDPANAYFEEVADDMAKLLSTGAAESLKQAYEMAIWSNPTVRAKEIAKMEADKQKAAKETEAARVNSAKAATAANLKLKSKPAGSAATANGSMRDTIQETWANMQAQV